MADARIRNDFLVGMQEAFNILLSNGSEGIDGVFIYLLSDTTTTNIYGETRQKAYLPPVLVPCGAHLNPTQGSESVEAIKNIPEFSITRKDLTDRGFSVDEHGLDILRKAMLKFHDVFYKVDNVEPTSYVEDVFLFYHFKCTELLNVKTLRIVDHSVDDGVNMNVGENIDEA